MKIFITGGTGFVGTTLTRVLSEQGHEITLLTRPSERVEPGRSGVFEFRYPAIDQALGEILG